MGGLKCSGCWIDSPSQSTAAKCLSPTLALSVSCRTSSAVLSIKGKDDLPFKSARAPHLPAVDEINAVYTVSLDTLVKRHARHQRRCDASRLHAVQSRDDLQSVCEKGFKGKRLKCRRRALTDRTQLLHQYFGGII